MHKKCLFSLCSIYKSIETSDKNCLSYDVIKSRQPLQNVSKHTHDFSYYTLVYTSSSPGCEHSVSLSLRLAHSIPWSPSFNRSLSLSRSVSLIVPLILSLPRSHSFFLIRSLSRSLSMCVSLPWSRSFHLFLGVTLSVSHIQSLPRSLSVSLTDSFSLSPSVMCLHSVSRSPSLSLHLSFAHSLSVSVSLSVSKSLSISLFFSLHRSLFLSLSLSPGQEAPQYPNRSRRSYRTSCRVNHCVQALNGVTEFGVYLIFDPVISSSRCIRCRSPPLLSLRFTVTGAKKGFLASKGLNEKTQCCPLPI